ncbi:hypothetical protein [Streptococcus suis]|uniref:hypothetical protein n=1 Tax=Streptococcus suis TaxID=1307 RepID=UPI000CF6DAA7|nr:hypothetical protein [Streptococcus suis]
MNKKQLSQRDWKKLKKKVVEESAVNVGYFHGIMQALPDYALMDAIRTIALDGWLTVNTEDSTLQNILVTESIKNLNYQDFKDVAPYLFSYPREQRDLDLLVAPVEVSRAYFEELKTNAEELFAIKQDVERLNQSIDKKIEELETDRLPNGDLVIGLDMQQEEVLLLRAPDTAHIDDWEVITEGLITDYRSTQSSETQTLNYLVGLDNQEFKTLIRSDVLNRDAIDGFVQVDKDVITEVAPATIPDFRTHRQFYQYAKQFASFREEYGSSYAGYVDLTYERDYPTNFGLDFYSQSILQSRIDDFNNLLSQEGKELVLHTAIGYSQGESYGLAYIREKDKETLPQVVDYLEHTVGAYYRGSLSELAVIKFENIDIEKGFNGQQEAVYRIDADELYQNKLKRTQARYPELQRFVSPEVAQKQQELNKEATKESSGRMM